MRLARFVSDERYGCPVKRVRVTTHLALEPAVSRSLSGGGELALGEPVEFGGVVEHDGEVVRIAQEVLLERRGQGRQSLVERGQLLLRRIVEAGAGVRHLAEAPLDEVALLGAEIEVVELLVDRLDAPIQGRVELYRVVVCRHQRRELFLDLLDLGRRVGGRDRVERAGDVAEQLAAGLERHHRVLERGHRADHGDGADLALLRGERLLESGQVVLRPDRRVVGQTVGERAGGQERVLVRHDGQPSPRAASMPPNRLQCMICKVLLAKDPLQA